MSCLLFSLLSYQTDKQLEEAKKEGMIKDMNIYTIDTGSSGTGMISFVSNINKFAVFAFRGTEFEVLRQMLTSLDFRTEYFASLNEEKQDGSSLGKQRANIRKVYLDEVIKATENSTFDQLFDNEKISPITLLLHLRRKGYKIYLTGHSLGGGLSTVFAARLLKLYDGKIEKMFDALVTFGATPVGDKNFVTWFEKRVPTSWRFVFGNEFAPMVPPIPWVYETEDISLVHAGDFHHFDLPKRKVPQNAKEANKLLEDLAYDTGLVDIFVHHNPFMTLRALRHYHNLNYCTHPTRRLKLDIKNK